jgi:hypothetical protein
MNIINKSRVLLIRFAKILPFILCGIVLISYLETIYSLIANMVVIWDIYLIPYKPISWAIANVVEYGWNTIIIISILSIATETCIWNKLSIAYLCVNLYEKDFFANIELYEETIIAICLINIIISSLLIYKGTKQLIKHN